MTLKYAAWYYLFKIITFWELFETTIYMFMVVWPAVVA
jgi:hypothetical protein